jgi:hypothetical protein
MNRITNKHQLTEGDLNCLHGIVLSIFFSMPIFFLIINIVGWLIP